MKKATTVALAALALVFAVGCGDGVNHAPEAQPAAAAAAGGSPQARCAQVAADLEGTLHSCTVGAAAEVRAWRDRQAEARGFQVTSPEANPVKGDGQVVMAVVFTKHLPAPDGVDLAEGYVRLVSQPDGMWLPDYISQVPPEEFRS